MTVRALDWPWVPVSLGYLSIFVFQLCFAASTNGGLVFHTGTWLGKEGAPILKDDT